MINLIEEENPMENFKTVEAYQMNNILIKQGVETVVKRTLAHSLDALDINEIKYKEGSHTINVDNKNCKAYYKLQYKLEKRRTLTVNIIEEGDTYDVSIKIICPHLQEVGLVTNNLITDDKYMADRFKDLINYYKTFHYIKNDS